MPDTVRFDEMHIPDPSTLRDYQKECIERIMAAPPGSYLVVLPTGAGKTFVFSHIPRKGRVLILSHRDELVHQPEKYYTLTKVYGPDGSELPGATFGTEQAGEHSNGEEVVSASVQTLVRRLDAFDPYDFDMIITDEAHHAVAPSYRKIYGYFKPRYHIGFTATPDRQDKDDLRKIYQSIIFMRDLKWGIKEGYLTDIEAWQVNVGYDLRSLPLVMGDFQLSGLGKRMLTTKCIANTVKAFRETAKGQTLIFAVNVRHAEALAEAINKACGEGTAACITGSTKNRGEVFKSFTERKLRCIVNCMVVTEGTDLPLVETVMIARPTMNAGLYSQMVGRGLRLYPGKEALRLIDCAGVTKRSAMTIGSLFGLSVDLIPEEKKEKLNGVRVTAMRQAVDRILDTPEFWISDRYVKLFSENNSVDLRDIAFTPMGDGSLTLSVGDRGLSVVIPPTDALGLTSAYVLSKGNPGERVRAFKEATLQDTVDEVYGYLLREFPDQRRIWDKRAIDGTWGFGEATEKQKAFIRKLLKKNCIRDGVPDLEMITRSQAAVIINRLINEGNGKGASEKPYSYPGCGVYDKRNKKDQREVQWYM